jgi:hypothetical protein
MSGLETALFNEDVYKVSVDVATDKRTTEEKRQQNEDKRKQTDMYIERSIYMCVGNNPTTEKTKSNDHAGSACTTSQMLTRLIRSIICSKKETKFRHPMTQFKLFQHIFTTGVV